MIMERLRNIYVMSAKLAGLPDCWSNLKKFIEDLSKINYLSKNIHQLSREKAMKPVALMYFLSEKFIVRLPTHY